MHVGSEASQGWLSQLFGGRMSVERAAYELRQRQPREREEPDYPAVPATPLPAPDKGETLALKLQHLNVDSESTAYGVTLGLASMLNMLVGFGLLGLLCTSIFVPGDLPNGLPRGGTVAALAVATPVTWGLFFYLVTAANKTPRSRPTRLEISPLPVYQGEKVRLWASQAGPLYLKFPLEIVLICEEIVGYSRGSTADWHKACVYRQVVARGKLLDIPVSCAEEFQDEFEFPALRMHSFESGMNKVQWRLRIQGLARRGRYFWREFEIVVRPQRRQQTVPALAPIRF